MRLMPLILMLAGSLVAGEPAFPLWDGSESVAEYAKKVNLPPKKTLDLGNGVKLELVLIPAGQFIMGTPEPTQPAETAVVGQTILVLGAAAALLPLLIVALRARKRKHRANFSLLFLLALVFAASVAVYGGVRWYRINVAWREYAAAKARYDASGSDEKPAHTVTLTKPFYMGKYDVTQEQYAQLIRANPSNFKGKDNPVEQVSWDDALAFCKKLSELSHQAVRLPTEAEWEYSCRAGTTTTYCSGDTEAALGRVAWYSANSKSTTHPVGQKEPNTFGLYDMHGNVWQWCQDFYGEDYYGESEAEDPQGPTQGAFRLLRGGSWLLNPMYCRSAARPGPHPGGRPGDLGFRVVVSPVSPQP
jgi:formylglycine-generating enzyme required for sulfatase activity